MTQKRKRLSGPEKIAIVKRYLVERVPISDLCDEHELQPSQIYRWHTINGLSSRHSMLAPAPKTNST
jgi:transposase-like protein